MDEVEDVVASPNGVVTDTEVVESTIVSPQIGEMTDEEFVSLPDENADGAIPMIVIRVGEGDQVFYRVWGFTDGSQLKAILAAAAHMGGQIADEHGILLKRLQGIVNVAVGR